MTPLDPFKIRDHVPDFEAVTTGYKALSNATRARLRSQVDIAYGEGDRERLDLFFPPGAEGGLPVHIFIHGGYWRANIKEDYAFIAETVTAAGAIAAIVEYSLMPGVRMAAIVDQVRRAACWVRDNAVEFGGDREAVSASGHSAGAHLASYLAARAPHETEPPATGVKSLLLLAGIYDLRPLTGSFLQSEILLTPTEVADWSPFEAVQDATVPITVAVGHDETEPFHLQAQDFDYAATARGAHVERLTAPGLNHVTVVEALGTPGTGLATALARTIAQSRSTLGAPL